MGGIIGRDIHILKCDLYVRAVNIFGLFSLEEEKTVKVAMYCKLLYCDTHLSVTYYPKREKCRP